MKRKNFMMIPRGIEKDPRLQPWMHLKSINAHAVVWAVERMIDRLAQYPERPFTLWELASGIYDSRLPYKVLKEIIVASGFFDYIDGYIRYNWERFAHCPGENESKDEEAETSEAEENSAAFRQLSGSLVCAYLFLY